MFGKKKKRKEKSIVSSVFRNEFETRNDTITKESAMDLSNSMNELDEKEDEIEDDL